MLENKYVDFANKKIEINSQFESALKLMENSQKHLLITGRAGTGKSTLLNYFVANTKKNIVVLAPTGVAAVNIGGQTIHSFFGFKPNITIDKVKKVYGPNSGIYSVIDTIIVDEISMVRADFLDCIDKFLKLNGKNKDKPFGGVQMIFIGDLYQLPPVVTSKEKAIFNGFYDSPYFFDSRIFKNIDIKFMELEKIYRQSDEKFINLLNAIRNKSITDKDIKEINKRLLPDFESFNGKFYINLTTTNKLSDEINAIELKKLESEEFIFEGKITGNFDRSYLPTEKILHLKEGAQVMLLNNEENGKWVNGTVGKIITIRKQNEKNNKEKFEIEVKLENGEIVKVKRNKWDMFQVRYNKETKKIESESIGSFVQYPLRLAWAVTIHKGQGKTFDRIIIDIGNGAFTHGQVYVALSRCTTLDGIILKKPIEKKHIWLDWKVVKFLTNFQYKISEKRISQNEKINLIKEAIDKNRKIDILYLKSNDQKSKRIIAPKKVGKMEYMGKDYIGVEAYCFKRNENRVFRVDRILELEIEK